MPVNSSKKKRVMINLDSALYLLIEQAAKQQRRSIAQYLNLLIEDSVLSQNTPVMEVVMENTKAKIAEIEDPKELSFTQQQMNKLLMRQADLQQSSST